MQNYKKLSDLLDSEECKTYVNQLLHVNPAQIALQYRDKIPCDASVLAYIVKLYQKALLKLPLWVENQCMLTTKSYEQATSQTVALYKSTFIQGKKLLVLGGGLGVDEWAFSKTFNTIISIDNDAELNKCVAYNYKCFQMDNVQRLTQTAEKYLDTLDTAFDCIYTDPDRRDDDKREISLQTSKPNILELTPILFKYTESIVLKASPLINIQQTVNELKNVNKVKVIAYNNEVKEILFCLEKDYVGEYLITACNYNLPSSEWQEYSAYINGEKYNVESTPANFFYEPNVALIKAGISHNYANNKKLSLISDATAYYTSEKLVNNFYGRSFEIVGEVIFSKKNVTRYLALNNIKKANFSKRNFRLSVEELRKLFLIKEGGDDYFFFTQRNGKQLMYHCIKA